MTLQNISDDAPPQTLRHAVAQALPGLNHPWQRLPGGRVNAVWRVGNTVVKQFHLAAVSPLFPNDPLAEGAALTLLAPTGLAPKLRAQGKDWLAYEFCPGAAWRSGTQPVAQALAALHHSTPPAAGFRLGANGSAPLLAQAKSIAALCTASLPPPPSDTGMAAGPPCLIHGDMVPGNVIVQNENVTFIDWQCPAIGDPAEDIATFLSPAMQYLYRGAPLTTAEAESFRAACPQHHIDRYTQLAAIFHWRMAAHCLWKSEQGAPDYAQALQLELAALQRLPQHHPDQR